MPPPAMPPPAMAVLAMAILAMAVLAMAAMAVEYLWEVEEDVLAELRRGPGRFEDGHA